MKARWNTVKLTDVAELSGRIGWKGLTAKEYTEEGPFFLSVHSLNHGDFVDFRAAFHISQARYDESPEIMLQSGDVLICKDGAGIGKVGIVGELPGQTTINSSLLLIRSKPKIEPKYLYYILMSPYFQAIVQSRLEGATTPHLYQRDIAGFPIHLPPLDEQRRIVAVLDKAFANIATATANAQKNLTNARALFESYLDQIFGDPVDDWDRNTIGEIAAIKGGKRVPKGYKLLNEQTPYPYISVADFNDEGSVDTAKIRYISEQIFSQIKRYIIRKEDLYISIAGTVGKTGIVPPNLDGASLTENACRLVFNKGVLNRFVYYFTLTSSFKEQAIEQTRTAAQPKLALSRLQQISLPIPAQNEQEQIISKFDDLAGMIRQTEAIYQTKLAALTELKQSLLQKAFAGELT